MSLWLHLIVSYIILLHIRQKQGLLLTRFFSFFIFMMTIYSTLDTFQVMLNFHQSNLVLLASGRHKLHPLRRVDVTLLKLKYVFMKLGFISLMSLSISVANNNKCFWWTDKKVLIRYITVEDNFKCFVIYFLYFLRKMCFYLKSIKW